MLNNLLNVKSYDLGPKAGFAALIAFLSFFTPLGTLAQSSGSDPVAALAEQIDPSVPANANFYRYAVGKSLGSLTISPDKVRAGALDAAKTLANSRMQTIVDDSLRSGSKPTTPNGQIAAAYTSFADRLAIEKRGDAPLQTDLALIRRARSRDGIARLAGRPGEYFSSFAWTRVWADSRFPTRSTIYVEVPDFALPNDRGFYLGHIQRTLELAHWPDPAKAAGEIIGFEGLLASAAASLAVQRDAVGRYHPMDVRELQRLAPGFDWIGYFQNRGVAATQRLIVYEPDSVRRMAAIWKNTPLATLKAWEAWQVTTNASRFLPARFRNEAFAFESKLTGVLELPSNESVALTLTNEIAGEQIGRLYASRYMSETKKRAVRALVHQLVLSAHARIVACGDCAATTKMAALAKLDRLVIDVGYPDHWASTKAEDLRPGDAYGNYDRAYAFYWRRDVRNLAKPVDRHSWEIRPQSVNLWLGSEHMQLGVAAGYLVTPYYQLDADPAINFGAIGAELAHEIGHLFDDQGRLYDASGTLTDWWAPSDAIRFTASAAKLRHQVDSYEPLPGIHLNSGLSLGEDIADIEGVRTALDAYHASLGGKPAPVIDGLTGDERFFLSYASSHLEKLRPEAMQRQIGSDPHPPDEARVNITVSNVDEWYAAFDIHPDTPMYVPPEQRTRFW